MDCLERRSVKDKEIDCELFLTGKRRSKRELKNAQASISVRTGAISLKNFRLKDQKEREILINFSLRISYREPVQ